MLFKKMETSKCKVHSNRYSEGVTVGHWETLHVKISALKKDFGQPEGFKDNYSKTSTQKRRTTSWRHWWVHQYFAKLYNRPPAVSGKKIKNKFSHIPTLLRCFTMVVQKNPPRKAKQQQSRCHPKAVTPRWKPQVKAPRWQPPKC